MATKRRAKAYSKRKPVVNTRKSKKQRYNYVKVAPPQKIVKFNMGNIKDFEKGVYEYKITMMTEEPIQIRDLALEAARQAIHKELNIILQKNYFLRCNVYPHNILRNNRVFSGGSKGERIQTGMSKSFGTPEGRAAILKKNKPIFTTYFSGESFISKVRDIFKSASSKLPCRTKILVEKIKKVPKITV
ncbi:MAG: 50S ribosomal protein L16 [Candidatus Pacearchaeota archaeon]